MIASIVFSSLAALVAISGLRCTRCLEEDEKLKDRAAALGGILSVCGGEFKIIEQITNKLLPETGVFYEQHLFPEYKYYTIYLF